MTVERTEAAGESPASSLTLVRCATPGCTETFLRPFMGRRFYCTPQCRWRARYAQTHGRKRPSPRVAEVVTVLPGPAEVGWAAGFIDGEGHLSIGGRTNGRYRLHIRVVQVVREPLDALVRLWGGLVRPKSYQRSPVHRPYWTWDISGATAIRMVAALRPYLRVKGDAADLMLMFGTLPGAFQRGYRPDGWDRAERDAIVEALHIINQRGIAA